MPCSVATSSSSGCQDVLGGDGQPAGDLAGRDRRHHLALADDVAGSGAAAPGSTVPAHGAATTASIFIALTTIRASPATTVSPAATRTSTHDPAIGATAPSSPAPSGEVLSR